MIEISARDVKLPDHVVWAQPSPEVLKALDSHGNPLDPKHIGRVQLTNGGVLRRDLRFRLLLGRPHNDPCYVSMCIDTYIPIVLHTPVGPVHVGWGLLNPS